MKRLRLLTKVFLIVGGMMMEPTLAASSWALFGLKNEAVNTVLTLSPGNGEDALMVGTSKGIWNHEYGRWVCVWQGLPVYDLKMIANERILAAAGNGTDSDGIYLGRVIARGEPGNIWQFKRIAALSRPTAVAYRATAAGDCSGKVYAGNSTGVFTGLLCNNTVDAMAALGSPEHPWGWCGGLYVSVVDSLLYAGGNYGWGIEYTTGLRDTSQFLKGTTELTAIKKIDVMSMTEYTSRNDTLLIIATAGNGIQMLKRGVLRTSRPSPERSEPVLSVVPFATQNFSGGTWTMLAAATPSGVYRECPPNADCIWSDFGAQIPASPRCLAQYQGKVLWAGTDSGVYRFQYTTAIRTQNNMAAITSLHLQTIRYDDNKTVFRFSGIDAAKYSLRILDLRGKCIGRSAVVGGSVTVPSIGSGVVVWRVYRGSRQVDGGVFVIR